MFFVLMLGGHALLCLHMAACGRAAQKLPLPRTHSRGKSAQRQAYVF